ncbi:tRNA (5-methylaminomethyl-2-thiouridine)(34)-methyltransferase MnmD [uncultured Porphyromonas sp.]|uniref:tRNA (5-methylaminomethyl-2-thiouridine)(34)-methyltransferase MnmD n=1 Tax=uncultured Porphyromonas sp. TaxID=159274 RepID=UPI00261A0A67|nr:tRNA (5-methylaminomethyl-2-thiouridine)(34)-methyltransferase MnmD [uncultured Porphyromonas sp.]
MSQTIPQLETTEDGSLTLYTPRFGEHYHSTHGAVQESAYIYLGLGLRQRLEHWAEPEAVALRCFEVGFGTGLNALLSWMEAERSHRLIHYYSIERYPIPAELYRQLHYELSTADALSTAGGAEDSHSTLMRLHEAAWDEDVTLSRYFVLHKISGDLNALPFPSALDLVYYDAFSPESQPELWREELFAQLRRCCRPGAILTTYCAKGEVRRRLERSGFSVERLPGPPGKREVLRATAR